MHETSFLLYMSWITTFLCWKLWVTHHTMSGLCCFSSEDIDFWSSCQSEVTGRWLWFCYCSCCSTVFILGVYSVIWSLLIKVYPFWGLNGCLWCSASKVSPWWLGGTPIAPGPHVPILTSPLRPQSHHRHSPPGPVSTRLALGQWPSENSLDIWALFPCTASSSQLPFLPHSSCLGTLEFLNSARAPCSSGIWPTTQYSEQCPWALSLGTWRDHLPRITVLTLPVV